MKPILITAIAACAVVFAFVEGSELGKWFFIGWLIWEVATAVRVMRVNV